MLNNEADSFGSFILLSHTDNFLGFGHSFSTWRIEKRGADSSQRSPFDFISSAIPHVVEISSPKCSKGFTRGDHDTLLEPITLYNTPMVTKDDNKDVKNPSNCDYSDIGKSPVVVKVAIVGAGFAGLTLANYLHHTCDKKNSKKIHYECLVFESKGQPIPIVGTFRLPLHVFTHVLEPIQQMRADAKIDKSSNMPPIGVDDSSGRKTCLLISRPQLLTWLRTSVPIQNSASVEAVRTIPPISTGKGDEAYVLSIRSSDGELSEVGPFDILVVASGFSLGRTGQAKTSSNKDDWKLNCTAIVGDARCSRHTWWDLFGQTRIQKGGAMAMMDGMKLGKRIVAQESEDLDLNEYSPHWHQLQQRKWQQRNRLILFATFLLLIVFLAPQK